MASITMTDVDPGEGSPLQDGNYLAVWGQQNLLDLFYPIGCYFETSDANFDPNVAWGGAWEQDTGGRVLVAQNNGTFLTLGSTGGEETHKLVTSEMPKHTHSYTSGRWAWAEQGGGGDIINSQSETSYRFTRTSGQTGGDGSHNNLQPYIVVKRWHRVG